FTSSGVGHFVALIRLRKSARSAFETLMWNGRTVSGFALAAPGPSPAITGIVAVARTSDIAVRAVRFSRLEVRLISLFGFILVFGVFVFGASLNKARIRNEVATHSFHHPARAAGLCAKRTRLTAIAQALDEEIR